ncbi:EAL domain-containing protein [Niallia oryzisoli]|uniref:EAL domain-containing protein n=1 Tax=Niallia oryzisoli TaxID=1737571 RepID=A0ABZ2C9B2_9BACI
MEKERIYTFFQPIVSLETGSTIGFEVLNRPETSSSFPNTEQFYDYVSSSSEVFMVERFLRNLSFERFAEQIKTSQGHKDHLVFINIQSQVLADPSYQSGITLELLAKHKLSPYQIVLELTEKEAVLNRVQFEKMIEHYRNQGFRIAVDDAGTGYNSLQTLVSVKPEFIKLDKSLIRDIDKHSEKQHIVELLLKFALKSDTTIIAEGIETLSELRFLKCLGIHLGQGYALGKPMEHLKDGCIPTVNPAFQRRIV